MTAGRITGIREDRRREFVDGSSQIETIELTIMIRANRLHEIDISRPVTITQEEA